jgi:NTE family protein
MLVRNKEITFPAIGRVRTLVAAAAAALLAACNTAPVSHPFDQTPAVACLPPALPEPVVPPPKPMRAPRVALALGGGAARGFAHIGVIEVLEENGIHPDIVTGTSAGSFVAALYASGRSGHEMADIALHLDESRITDWSFPGRGLIRGDALADYVREMTGKKPLQQTKIPLGIVATDLDSGKTIVFRQGDIGTAVRASSAVPAVFMPVRIGTHEYVDGGLTSPVPVRAARDMGADVIIAVDISQLPDGGATGDAMHMLLQTFSIMGRSINELELKDAEVVVRPKLVGVAGTDFTVRQKNIQAGRDAATALLPLIRQKVAQQVPVSR